MKTTALVCIAKDEDKYIQEWFEYHHRIGFDKIFIYQNNWRIKKAVPDYVELVEFDGEALQMLAYNHFICNNFNSFGWAMFMDVDEYLNLNGQPSVIDAFQQYSSYLGVAFNWKVFGDSGLHYDDTDNSVRKRFTMSQTGFNKHVKVALNLNAIRKTGNLQFMMFNNPHTLWPACSHQLIIAADMKSYVVGPYNEMAVPRQQNYTYPYIHHYLTKTIEEWREKVLRGKADMLRANPDYIRKIDEFNSYNFNEVRNFDIADF